MNTRYLLTSRIQPDKQRERIKNAAGQYGHMLADSRKFDGTIINHELVKEGWCWWYQKYAPGNTVLEGLEREAREAKKGLWPTRILRRRGNGGSGRQGAGGCRSCNRYRCRSTVATNLLAEAFNARDSLMITLKVGDFSPRSN